MEATPEPDLVIEEHFIAEPDVMYSALVATVTWDERMRARKTATFGRAYNYSGMIYPDTLMPEILRPVVARLAERLGWEPNNCLLNYYESGESTMGFHADSTVELEPGTGVAIVSLGAEREITFKSKKKREIRHLYKLPAGSLLFMPNDVQAHWLHAIQKQENTGGRISLTFRRLA